MLTIKPFVVPALLIVTLAGCDRADSEAVAPTPPTTEVEVSEVATTEGEQPEACTSGQLGTAGFAGGWNVQNGEAQFGGHTTRTGTNDITLRDSNGGLTMTIEGFPTVRLQRVARGRPDWNWSTGPNVAVSGQEILVVFGCANQAGMARFTGQARVDAEGASGLATFRLIMVGPNEGVLHWEIGPPMASSGLFNIARAE